MSILTKLPEQLYDATAFNDFSAAPDFRIGNAKAMAWLSQLAYETDDQGKMGRVLTAWDLELVGVVSAEVETVLPIACTNAFVAAGRDAVLVAFAGTDPFVLANWISDFDCRLELTGAAQGFAEAASIVRERLDGIVAARTEAKSLFITGHSLGGALAVVTAAGPFEAADAVYTFGAPRPGSADFARNYNGASIGMATYRLVYGEDIVPTVAPTELGFRHVGRYLRCARDEKFDQRALAADTSSDAPPFVDGEARDIRDFFSPPPAAAGAAVAPLPLPADMVWGRSPSGGRTDPAGIFSDLLPVRLHDHELECYRSGFA